MEIFRQSRALDHRPQETCEFSTNSNKPNAQCEA
nr:MAG TPA: hypothetical protein [Caudoviricetes sp.]